MAICKKQTALSPMVCLKKPCTGYWPSEFTMKSPHATIRRDQIIEDSHRSKKLFAHTQELMHSSSSKKRHSHLLKVTVSIC